jgi:hypothetical protein
MDVGVPRVFPRRIMQQIPLRIVLRLDDFGAVRNLCVLVR